MSGKNEKALRRAGRAQAGISKEAEREQHAFEDAVAALRMRGVLRSQEPIVSLQPKRRALAIVVLALWAVSILALILGSC